MSAQKVPQQKLNRQSDRGQRKQSNAPKSDRSTPIEAADIAPGAMIDNVMRSPLQESPATPLRECVQPKLAIGEPNDKYEQEADRVAKVVVGRIRAPESSPLMNPNGGEEPSLQCKDDAFQQIWRPMLQADGAAGGTTSEEFDRTLNNARSGGQALDSNVQHQMGETMGADFSGVRVHTDATANALSESIQAKAFTTGRDVFFKRGAYQPGSQGGQELIAHELTHVVQQSGATLQTKKEVRGEESDDTIQRRSYLKGREESIQRKIVNLQKGDDIIDRFVRNITAVTVEDEKGGATNIEPGHQVVSMEQLGTTLGPGETLYLAAHGSTQTLAGISANDLATTLKEHLPAGYAGKIVLVSCHTGEARSSKKSMFSTKPKWTDSYAADLKKALKRQFPRVKIMAPVGAVQVTQGGDPNAPMQLRAVKPEEYNTYFAWCNQITRKIQEHKDVILEKMREINGIMKETQKGFDENVRPEMQELEKLENEQDESYRQIDDRLEIMEEKLKNLKSHLADAIEFEKFMKEKTEDVPEESLQLNSTAIQSEIDELQPRVDSLTNELKEAGALHKETWKKLQNLQKQESNMKEEFQNQLELLKQLNKDMIAICDEAAAMSGAESARMLYSLEESMHEW